jgi:hypothetical protein
MELLTRFDEKFVRQTLENECPDLQIINVRIIENGWDNYVAEINGNYIFRFPKRSEYNSEKEIQVLGLLKGKVTLQIPKILYRGKNISFIGYEKIKGGEISEEKYSSLTDIEKQKLASDIANFAYEIHSKFSIAEAKEIGIQTKNQTSDLEIIRSNLPKLNFSVDILIKIEDIIYKYLKYTKEETEQVVLYGDLYHP